MKIGIHTDSFSYPGGSKSIADTLAEIVKTCEKGGFYSVWPMDHFFQIGNHGPPEQEMLETYSTMAFMAGITNKIKIGALVTGVIYRHPGILVKTVTTLDILSKGRAYLGIGAAWNEQEARGLGVPFPPLKERFERLEETLQIVKQMWSGNEQPFNGKYYHLERPLNSPQPLTRPHPQILIGGTGEKKTLKLVAKYADACNIFSGQDINVVKHKLDVLKMHCEKVGRNYDEIEKTFLLTVDMAKTTPEQIIADLKKYHTLGFSHGIFTIRNDHDLKIIEKISQEIIPVVSDL